jgi:murein DD-endopeptidase MepM/ murein hydrolase activator NlpD
MKKAGMIVTFIVGIFLVVTVSALVYNYLEWEKPQVKITDAFNMIGQKMDVAIKVADSRSGIRNITVSLIQKLHTFDVASIDIPDEGVYERTVSIEVSPRKLKMTNGPAVLEVKAVDYSPLHNTMIIKRNVTIDMVPLHVSLLTMAHNVNPGGTCMAAYTLSKAVTRSGVMSGNVFFPGYPETTSKGKTYYVCYFAVPIDVSRATMMNVFAEDRAGNRSIVPISFYIRSAHTFRDDKLAIGADFIVRKAAEFQQDNPDLDGKPVEEAFTYINTQMRKANENTIHTQCLKTDPKQLWQAEFLMMRNGATKARFGDRRTYELNGKAIGVSLHQGIDVASTEHAPVEASNSGTITFAGSLGIYGNAIIIDHGQGISSLYGHMSALQVSEGQKVQRGQVIGSTGSTGWAGGDHLHFSILVNGVFVNPIEWWDPHWIKDNVDLKLQDAQAGL